MIYQNFLSLSFCLYLVITNDWQGLGKVKEIHWSKKCGAITFVTALNMASYEPVPRGISCDIIVTATTMCLTATVHAIDAEVTYHPFYCLEHCKASYDTHPAMAVCLGLIHGRSLIL